MSGFFLFTGDPDCAVLSSSEGHDWQECSRFNRMKGFFMSTGRRKCVLRCAGDVIGGFSLVGTRVYKT